MYIGADEGVDVDGAAGEEELEFGGANTPDACIGGYSDGFDVRRVNSKPMFFRSLLAHY